MINTLLQVATATAPINPTVTIILAVVGTVGAGGLVKLAQMYFTYRKELKTSAGADGNAFRNNLQERVVELEGKVDTLNDRIEEMIKMYTERIIVLSTENARLHAELEAAHKEIEHLLADLEDMD